MCFVTHEPSAVNVTGSEITRYGGGESSSSEFRQLQGTSQSQYQRREESSSKGPDDVGHDEYDPALYGSFQDWLEAFTVSEEAPASPETASGLRSSLPEPASRSASPKGPVLVSIEGLFPNTERSDVRGAVELNLELSDYVVTTIHDLKEPGDDGICGFEIEGKHIPLIQRHDDWIPVEVIETESAYSLETGLAVNLDVPLDQFYDGCIRGWKHGTPGINEISLEKRADSIIISDRSPTSVEMTVERTVRLPERRLRPHNCPLPLGPIPFVRSTQLDAQKSIPEVEILLYQREALMLKFRPVSGPRQCVRAPTEDPSNMEQEMFAIGVLDGSNTNSDILSKEGMEHVRKTAVVIPKQELLPGWPAHSAYPQQFVAMPLGENYSTEYQTTQAERYGGMQLVITPKFVEEGEYRKENEEHLVGSKTAREQGLYVGEILLIRGPSTPEWSKSCHWTQSFIRDYCHTMTSGEDAFDQSRPLRVWELKCALARMGVELNRSEKAAALRVVRRIAIRVTGGQGAPDKIIDTVKCCPFSSLNELRGLLVATGYAICHRFCSFRREDGTKLTLTSVGTLRDLGINSGDLLTIEFPNPSAYDPIPDLYRRVPRSASYAARMMGIGAGAILYQRYSSIRCCWHWNWKQSKIINIRISNAAAFQSFSDGALPEDPISFKDYLDSGFPFLDATSPSPVYRDPVLYALQAIEKTIEKDVGENIGENIEKNIGKSIVKKFESIGEIDAARGVKMDIFLRSGRIIGCAVCAMNLVDTILMPCKHVACSDCIKTYVGSYAPPRRGVCLICQGTVERSIRFSGPGEIPEGVIRPIAGTV
ncbi:hypothetical protein F5Y17DRAFT_90142 [Xylariaceae sp. FL0594]|nr:hypothetical protein F5Y17DRAFT_90142 [Xylariaceae sp. FL0594]